MAVLEDLADNTWYVLASYILAFVPWALYSDADRVSSRWQKISGLEERTRPAVLWYGVSFAVLLVYFVVQFLAEDWKEAMATWVVLMVEYKWPIARLSRQWWLQRSSEELGRLLLSVPNLGNRLGGSFRMNGSHPNDGALWDAGNSSSFFDSDRPGDGVTDLELRYYWRLLLRTPRKGAESGLEPRLLDCYLAGTGDGVLLDMERYQRAVAVVKFKLRVLTDSDWVRNKVKCAIRRFKTSDGDNRGKLHQIRTEGMENALTRAAWLYENLTGPSWMDGKRGLLGKVLQLGLVVHVSTVFLDGYDSSKPVWVRVLTGQQSPPALDEFGVPLKLRKSGCILKSWFSEVNNKPEKVDFQSAFARLPADHQGVEELSLHHDGPLCWQHIMFIACNTIELHAFVHVIYSNTKMGDDVEAQIDTVWKYVTGAYISGFAVNSSIGSSRTLANGLSSERRKSLATAGWANIIDICGEIADRVTLAMHRTAGKGEDMEKLKVRLGELWEKMDSNLSPEPANTTG